MGAGQWALAGGCRLGSSRRRRRDNLCCHITGGVLDERQRRNLGGLQRRSGPGTIILGSQRGPSFRGGTRRVRRVQRSTAIIALAAPTTITPDQQAHTHADSHHPSCAPVCHVQDGASISEFAWTGPATFARCSRPYHPLCAISPGCPSALDRHFLSGSDGHGLRGSGPVSVPRLGSQRRGWLPEWLPNVRRSISGHATKPLPYKALLARPEELESPTF